MSSDTTSSVDEMGVEYGEMSIDWTTREVPLSSLQKNDYNPRGGIDDVSDVEGSLDKIGILSTLTVRPVDNGYEVISGSRRLTALQKKFGENSNRLIPVRDAGTIDDETALSIARIENTVRRDLKPMSEARDFAQSVQHNGMTYMEYVETLPDSLRASAKTVHLPSGGHSEVQKIAQNIPNSGSNISQRLSLLLLPERMHDWVDNYAESDDIYPQLPITAASNIIDVCRSKADDPEESLTLIDCVAESVAAQSLEESVTTTDRGDIQSIVLEKMDEMDFVNSIGDDEDIDLREMITTYDGDETEEDDATSVDFDAIAADGDVEVSSGSIEVPREAIEKMEHTCPVCNRPFEADHDGEAEDVLETLNEYMEENPEVK